MRKIKIKYGILGAIFGSTALLLTLVHFWAGPFSPQPTIETIVAEKAASIRKATLDVLKGKKLVKKEFVSEWDFDKIIDVIATVLGGLAIIFAVIGFIKKESSQATTSAVALGVGAIAFQFIAMYAMALLVVLLIAAALSGIGLS